MPRPSDADLADQVSEEGHPPGSRLHKELLVAKRVERCQAAHEVNDCLSCPTIDFCPLICEHTLNLRYGELSKLQKARDVT